MPAAGGAGGSKRKLVALAGWDPGAKDPQVEVDCDALTGGHYKVSCQSTERAWIGLRGRPGVVSGAYCFEVKVTEGLLRVGWASGTASFSLGTDGEGFGYGGTGKKSHLNKFADYGGAFEAGDVVTCCVDRGSREISFGVNGQHLGKAFAIPRQWDGVALFPALCAREAFRATGYFGCPEHPKVPHGCRFWPLGDAYAEDVVESDSGPPPAEELAATEEPAERKLDRAERFTKLARVDQELTKLSSFVPDETNVVGRPGALVGRSRALERGYLRDAEKLRDPAQIRPLPVLREAVAHVLRAQRPWAWEAEMLRAMRQDLTVQNEEGSSFMEEVCEISALHALANSDWPTFAACAPTVRQRPRAAELAWLLLLGSAPLACSRGLQHAREPESATAQFVRAVLADASAGRWTGVLRHAPPTEAAAQAYGTVVRPLALAKVLAITTKAFASLRVDTLHALGVSALPAGVEAVGGVLNGKGAHSLALLQVEAAQKPTQRDDHSQEFLR